MDVSGTAKKGPLWWPHARSTVNSSSFGNCNSTSVSRLSHLRYRALQASSGSQVSSTREESRFVLINECSCYCCSSEMFPNEATIKSPSFRYLILLSTIITLVCVRVTHSLWQFKWELEARKGEKLQPHCLLVYSFFFSGNVRVL